MDEQRFTANLESYKLEQDFMKHLASLSTGSILLMVTFLEKLLTSPISKYLVATSLVAFVVSIACTLVVHFMSVLDVDAPFDRKLGPIKASIAVGATLGAFGGFLLGLGSLVLFALRNL